jgi:exopolysaccharide production protein ExoZ
MDIAIVRLVGSNKLVSGFDAFFRNKSGGDMQKIVSVQYLRAIAAISVMLYHGWGINHPIEKNIFSFGAYGVDIFFFISGFIMAITMIREPDYEEFFKKRLLRIYPMFFLGIIFSVAMGLTGLSPLPEKFSFNFTLFKIFDDSGEINEMYLPCSWTLYYEMFFYFICACCLWLFKSYKTGMRLFFLIILFLPQSLNFINPNWEFSLIFLAGFYFYQCWNRFHVPDFICLILCLGKISQVFDDGIERMIIILTSMLFIAVLQKIKFKEIRSLALLGESSYSLYLLHFPLCYAIKKLLPSAPFLNLALFSFFMVVIIFISVLNYEFIEKKIAKKGVKSRHSDT